MGTAQDQCVHVFIFKFLKISGCNLCSNRIVKPSFLHQRNKQGTGFADHCDLRIQFFQIRCMDAAVHSSYGADHTHSLILCFRCSNSRSGFYHSQNGNIKFIPHCLKGKSACSIAGDHDCLNLLLHKKMNDLSGIPDNIFSGLPSIGYSGCISKIYDFF